MAQTVVGIFKNSSEAQNAKKHLLKNGFSDNIIDISSQPDKKTDQDEDWGDKVTGFFKNLFSSEEESSKYSRAASGSTVVTVHVQDSDEAEIAADILDDHGAIDVNEYARSFENTPTSAGSDTSRASDPDDTSVPVNIKSTNNGQKEGQAAETRSRSQIVDRPVEETNRLREEDVNKEGKTGYRAGSEEDLDVFMEGPVEFTEDDEIVVINEEVWVVEEVDVFEDVDEKQETIREIIRDTEEKTDDLEKGNVKDEDQKTLDREKLDEAHRQRPGII